MPDTESKIAEYEMIFSDLMKDMSQDVISNLRSLLISGASNKSISEYIKLRHEFRFLVATLPYSQLLKFMWRAVFAGSKFKIETEKDYNAYRWIKQDSLIQACRLDLERVKQVYTGDGLEAMLAIMESSVIYLDSVSNKLIVKISEDGHCYKILTIPNSRLNFSIVNTTLQNGRYIQPAIISCVNNKVLLNKKFELEGASVSKEEFQRWKS